MVFLSRSPLVDSGGPAHALLSLTEPEALQAAINALEPDEAALAIGQAPTLEEKSRLVWALEPARRRAALDQLHPGMIGALIQNREAENKALLGDLSREQFTCLLRFCSPAQAFYWLTLAAACENPRASMLPLLIPVEELAAALVTRPEFVLHCQEVGSYSVGEFHLDLQDEFLDITSATVTVLGPEGAVIEEFPILEDDLPARDPRLRRLLHTLEHHPDHYRATVTVISTEGDLEEIPLRDPRLRRLLHKLLDYELEQYTALLNLFGPEGVLREFPIQDRRLRRLLKRILDHDPEQYIELVQAALVLYDYEGGHPEEREILFESPVVLHELLTVDEERARAGLSRPDAPAASAAGRSPEPARSADPNVASTQGEELTFLSRSPLRNSDSPVQALLSLEEPEALQAAIQALEPEDAALAIGRAPSLEEKSRLIWALTPERRAEVLAQLHPGFIGTLIQNREAENRALLGVLSREQFTRLLRYCSPERACYWLTLAASFEHARANLLPLPIPITDLAAAMLTQPEFGTHCRQIAGYVEDLGLDMTDYRDLALALVSRLGAEGMLREFPLRDHRLRQFCQTMLDHGPECYGDLIYMAWQLSDHASNHPEEQMTLLSRSPLGDPESQVQALLSIEEPQALQAAMNVLEPEDAALAIGQAPSVEEKSRLVWALEPERRAEVLDHLHPGFVGALIQNQEAENKALLGDLSREQFTRLLRFCSPERAYYWLTLATSFEDARANMLPLLVPVNDLAAAMLTQPEFETHCLQIGDYSVEGLGLDLAQLIAEAASSSRDLVYVIVTVFGAGGMLREFPIQDRRLRQLCQTVLDLNPEYYSQLIHTALHLSDYQGNHSEEQEILREEPVLLDHLLSLEEERCRTGLVPQAENAARPAAADMANAPSLPARQSAELMRAAAAALPAQRQNELSLEMQLLFLQEAAYAGGSFLQADLEQAAGRVQSYIQLGLAGLSQGSTEQAAQLLSEQRLRTLMESGARQVERLRQVALRLEPWHEVLDKEQIRLLEGLVHPDLGIEEESHRPVLRLRKAPRSSVVESIDLETARARLEAIDAWIALVRAVGKARIRRRKGDADTSTLTRDLLVAAVLYRLWDPALVETADRSRFRETYLDATTGRWSPAAYRALAEALRSLAAERHLEPAAVQKIARLLAHAMDELAAAGSPG